MRNLYIENIKGDLLDNVGDVWYLIVYKPERSLVGLVESRELANSIISYYDADKKDFVVIRVNPYIANY